jgi:hypothetical protein
VCVDQHADTEEHGPRTVEQATHHRESKEGAEIGVDHHHGSAQRIARAHARFALNVQRQRQGSGHGEPHAGQ